MFSCLTCIYIWFCVHSNWFYLFDHITTIHHMDGTHMELMWCSAWEPRSYTYSIYDWKTTWAGIYFAICNWKWWNAHNEFQLDAAWLNGLVMFHCFNSNDVVGCNNCCLLYMVNNGIRLNVLSLTVKEDIKMLWNNLIRCFLHFLTVSLPMLLVWLYLVFSIQMASVTSIEFISIWIRNSFIWIQQQQQQQKVPSRLCGKPGMQLVPYCKQVINSIYSWMIFVKIWNYLLSVSFE